MWLPSVVFAIAVTSIYALPAQRSNETGDELSFRIWYGEYANIADYPYYAFIGNCGAGIISNRWLVTAAHCVEPIKKRRNRAWVGGNTTKTSQLYTFDRVFVHPLYNDDDVTINDIALLHLTRPLTFSRTVQPVELPETEYELNVVHRFAGRGKDEHYRPTKHLMSMKVRTLDVEECVANVPAHNHMHWKYPLDNVKNVTICVKRTTNKPGSCHGDSGSPLVRNNVLVGLCSHGQSQCYIKAAEFYTNVAPFVDWIRGITDIGYSDLGYGEDNKFQWNYRYVKGLGWIKNKSIMSKKQV